MDQSRQFPSNAVQDEGEPKSDLSIVDFESESLFRESKDYHQRQRTTVGRTIVGQTTVSERNGASSCGCHLVGTPPQQITPTTNQQIRS